MGPRFGAVGRKGSIALIERFWRTLKSEGFRRTLVPYRLPDFEDELEIFRGWFNESRPHSALGGATPNEAQAGMPSASQRPRVETRTRYPVPEADVDSGKVRRVDFVELRTTGFHGRKYLPDVQLDMVA